MARVCSIQASTHSKAERLGAEMAADSLIKPVLKDVAQHFDYLRFRNAHRALWEQSARFETYYQERIFSLADREAKRDQRDDLDSVTSWDAWYATIVHPIKIIVWQTWEKANRLEARYLEALVNSGRATPSEILRMHGQSDDSDLPESLADVVANEHANQGVVANLFGWWRKTAV